MSAALAPLLDHARKLVSVLAADGVDLPDPETLEQLRSVTFAITSGKESLTESDEDRLWNLVCNAWVRLKQI